MGEPISKESLNKAVFLDRDGTVNEEVGYITDLGKLKLIPGVGTAIRSLNDAGFKVILVTNQSGVARGYFPESLVHEAHARIEKMLQSDGARIDAVYYCPHHPTAGSGSFTVDCNCRKPKTGLIEQAASDLKIDISRSYMVGDKWSDVELGHRAGVRAVLVKSGFAHDAPDNKRTDPFKGPDYHAQDLSEAADWIIRREQQK